jgi:ankyrin repeat protein
VLIDNGADVNAKTKGGFTALMEAARLDHKEVAKLLIDNKADVNAKENNGKTALMYAKEKNHKEIVSLLTK